VYLESVLLERPVGDRFLDRDLWADALPVGSPEARVLLGENGLRAGRLVGPPPQRFQELLDAGAGALDGRRMTGAARAEKVLPTSGPHERCAFEFRPDFSRREAVALAQARCGVLVRPEPAGPGCVKLSCEPQIQHGERRELFRPSADSTRLVKADEIPLARYPELAFDVPLGPNEYLLIGWHADRPGTLGAALFAVRADGQPRQRVLVVRARQADPGAAPDLPPLGPTRRSAVATEASRPAR
jgi:hypothetical protein